MANRFQPQSHAERAELLSTMDAFLARPDADRAAVDLIETFLRPGAEQYRVARIAFVNAEAAYNALSARVDAADLVFDKAMRKFAASLDDEEGRRDSAALRSLLGGRSMSEVIKMKATDEVVLAREMLARVAVRTDVRTNAERVAALQAATEALATVAGPWKEAERALRAAGIAQEDGASELRTAWSDFMRFARRNLDEATLAALTPPYVRRVATEERGATPETGGGETPGGGS